MSDRTVEAQLAAIWAELLPPDTTIGSTDNLFALGATSLAVIRFIGQVLESFGVELAVHLVFDQPTIAEIAVVVAGLTGSAIGDPTVTVGPTERPESAPHPALAELSDEGLDDLLRAALLLRERRRGTGTEAP
jgi:hypothetical protein